MPKEDFKIERNGIVLCRADRKKEEPMKFTEGYWEKNERANMRYAVQAFRVEKIPGGIRITAPVKRIESRSDALDTPTITTEIVSAGRHIFSVRSYHFLGYQKNEPRFQKNVSPVSVVVRENKREVILEDDGFQVRVDKKEWLLTYEKDGKLLTSCGFRNLGYAQYDRERATMLPHGDYMRWGLPSPLSWMAKSAIMPLETKNFR